MEEGYKVVVRLIRNQGNVVVSEALPIKKLIRDLLDSFRCKWTSKSAMVKPDAEFFRPYFLPKRFNDALSMYSVGLVRVEDDSAVIDVSFWHNENCAAVLCKEKQGSGYCWTFAFRPDTTTYFEPVKIPANFAVNPEGDISVFGFNGTIKMFSPAWPWVLIRTEECLAWVELNDLLTPANENLLSTLIHCEQPYKGIGQVLAKRLEGIRELNKSIMGRAQRL